MLSRLVADIVRICTAYAGWIVLLAVLLAIAGGGYAGTHFQLDNNSDNLVSPNAAWRQNEIRYDNAFPQQNNTIAIVIDGVTAERADEAAGDLAAMLAKNHKQFLSVRRPDGGPFFTREGLLLMPVPELKQTLDTLVKAQPFLGGLAADPSLRGVMKTLDTSLLGVTNGQTTLDTLDKPLTAFNATLKDVLAGRTAMLGWSNLLAGKGNFSRTRRFVEVQPKLDFSALLPGQRATRAVRNTARRLKLDPENGVRVRITGQVPMADDEFASITDRGALLAGLMIGATLVMLWLALRSVRMILAIVATIIIGLAITAAIGLLIYTRFNVISVAFIVLFVGLGVDFGIQFCVRYRAERHRLGNLEEALVHTGSFAGPGLTLAAVAVAVAFYSFLPTNYAGLAQLGGIAGTGMVITYILSITLLPALLRLLNPAGEAEEIGFSQLRPLDKYLTHNCRRVLIGALVIALLGACAMPFMHFDSNPLDLRNPKSESVATALDLMKDPETSPNTINVLRPTAAEARALADRLSKMPQVSQTLTIESFVPDKQAEKLALIRDTAGLLDTVFHPFFVAPPPSDKEVIAALRDTANGLRNAAKISKGAPADHARALAATLEQLANASPIARTRAANAFIPGLKTLLKQLKTVLHPAPIRFATLPPDLKRDWIAPDGAYRVQVSPVGNPNNRQLRNFTKTILATTPDATGAPVVIYESAHTIVWAFVEAGIISFVTIVIILFMVLRRFGDEMMTLVPLVLAGVLTTATAVVFGIQFNFANIIALPLLFGVGVAFDIYFVMWWREGRRDLLESPLTRAVLMSAGTTGAAFGTLSLSSHPGTASMGLLLMISLFWILVTMLIVLPALLHRLLPNEGLELQAIAEPDE